MALEISGAHLGLHSPLSEAVSANAFWSVDGALRYGNRTIFDRAPGIFDTGSSLLGLATGELLRDL